MPTVTALLTGLSSPVSAFVLWVSPFSFILAAPSVKQHCKEERIRILPQWCGRLVKSRKLLFQIIVIKGGCMSYWIMGCTLLNQRLIPVLMVHTLYSCKKTTTAQIILCARVKKFSEHQINYITIENESLALFLERQHFEVYVRSSSPTVYGIHRPSACFPILDAY